MDTMLASAPTPPTPTTWTGTLLPHVGAQVAPLPSWPLELSPHVQTVPSERSAIVWLAPPATATTLVPYAVVTVTSTVPAAAAGAVTVMRESELTTIPVPAVPPKLTPVAPVKNWPAMVTMVPPAVLPRAGKTPVTLGPWAMST